MKKAKKAKIPEKTINLDDLPSDVKTLREELRKALLMNEVLTEVINITEEELGRPI